MIAPHEREVVADLRRIGHESARAGVLGEERALDLDPHDIGLIAVGIDTQVERIERCGRQPADG